MEEPIRRQWDNLANWGFQGSQTRGLGRQEFKALLMGQIHTKPAPLPHSHILGNEGLLDIVIHRHPGQVEVRLSWIGL